MIHALVFVLEAKSGSCRDYQEIKVQELIQNLSLGTIPRSMWVVLEDDLVDSCKPGDDVTVCGIITRRWKSVKLDVSIVVVCRCIRYPTFELLCKVLVCSSYQCTTKHSHNFWFIPCICHIFREK